MGALWIKVMNSPNMIYCHHWDSKKSALKDTQQAKTRKNKEQLSYA